MLGLGTAGQQVLQWLVDHDHEVVVVDEDAGVVARLSSRGIPAIQADGSDLTVLGRVHAREAVTVVCLLPRRQDFERVLVHLAGSGARVIVRVFEPADAVRVERLGGVPVVTADVGADRFCNWFLQNRDNLQPAG